MDIKNKVTVITGGAHGIGECLCHKFAERGAKIVVADLENDPTQKVADEIGGLAVPADVGDPDQVQALLTQARQRWGPVDIVINNAGIMRGRSLSLMEGGPFQPDDEFNESWDVNVMAHVRTARAVLPDMLSRGSGYIVNVASAAGLLSEYGSLAYTATKHAAVGLSEWLAITYGPKGIKVSCVCPLGVDTSMVTDIPDGFGSEHLREGMISAADVADAIVDGISEERFLILPHPQVHTFMTRKADNTDRWLKGMQKYRATLYGDPT